ncbi:MAG: hypothetical protein K0M54_14250 [Pseudomonas sp.]|uniref:hypothetical protein n=1 Tax=unclassified Pseudomonas TaxID=196821 RepID=UPI00223420BD|nr:MULTISPECIES: hypothetical protein [unclassified Pseudomonas]MBW8354980.1 hypothetical protein [Pseudomonas sp.]UZE37224.1 hypothetical protein LOY69_12255 [Pseudomonas sp. B21-059]
MPLNKRQQAAMERLLAVTLTEACESAKAQIEGFAWLTHEADYAAFPSSLVVVWVFDTQAHKERALDAGQGPLMIELTARALNEAQVCLDSLAAHVFFDSEEQCRRGNAGDWAQRLKRLRPGRG